jgi:hypothetical protein
MYKVRLIIICFLIFLFSCSEKNVKQLSYSYTQDTLVSKDTIFSGIIDVYSIKEINDSVFIALKKFNSNLLLLYLYQNDSLELVRSLSLSEDYFISSTFGKISSIDIISIDRVLICQKFRISILDLSNGEIDFTYMHSDANNDILLSDLFQPIIWNSSDNTILCHVMRFDDINDREHDADTEIGAKIDLGTACLSILPIKYPDVYKTNLRFTSFSNPFIICSNEYYVGAFGITPDLVVLSKKEKKLMNIKVSHLNMVNVEPFDTIKSSEMDYYGEHYDLSINYLQIIYDPFKDLYYRFYTLPIPKGRNNDGLLYTFEDKKLCVSVLTSDFKVKGDVVFEEKIFFKNWYPTKQGLMQIKYLKQNNKYVIGKIVFGN